MLSQLLSVHGGNWLKWTRMIHYLPSEKKRKKRSIFAVTNSLISNLRTARVSFINSTSNYVWFRISEDDVIGSILTCWSLQRKTWSARNACFLDRNTEKGRVLKTIDSIFPKRVSIFSFLTFWYEIYFRISWVLM